MKSVIIYSSYAYKNTEKICKVIADTLGSELLEVEQAKDIDFADYDLIGFASGIYYRKFHKKLFSYISNLSSEDLNKISNKSTFLVYTSGVNKSGLEIKFKNLIENLGFNVIGTFYEACFDDFGPLKLIGGINKNKPDEESYRKAKEFANSLLGEV